MWLIGWRIRTSAAAVRELSLHVLDLLENARAAGATVVSVEIIEDLEHDRLELSVRDDGHGLAELGPEKAFDPFYTTRTTRRVGLGLPLLQAAAERAGGCATLESVPGHTLVRASFRLSHIDRAPMGDIAGTLITFMLLESAPRLAYRHCVGEDEFEFDTASAEEAAGRELTAMDVSGWVRDYLNAGIGALKRSMS